MCDFPDKEIESHFFITVPKQKADGTMVLSSDPQQGSITGQNNHIPSIEPGTDRAWFRPQATPVSFPPISLFPASQDQL